jgi:hypothetical protein
VSVAVVDRGTASRFTERDAVSSTSDLMIDPSVLFWITPTLRPTSGGMSFRSACGRITFTWRPDPAEGERGRGLMPPLRSTALAPRVVSAIWAFPHSASPRIVARNGRG